MGFSEIDEQAEKTYRKFFGEEEINYGDLMKIDTKKLPDFDVMIAGFSCQTFSVIGQRKGMGDARGQIIYGLIKIMKEKNLICKLLLKIIFNPPLLYKWQGLH